VTVSTDHFESNYISAWTVRGRLKPQGAAPWPDTRHFPATSTLPSFSTMSHIQVFVEDYWGMRVEFRVTPSDPVHTLKQLIEETDGKPIGVCAFFM
jgi:hypothetical protein